MQTIAPKPQLCIRLNPSRRFVSKLMPGQHGTIVRYRHSDTSGWDWYDVAYDLTPELIHQCRRDALKPLRAHYRPLYAKLCKN